ncbi:MAG: hypothetical protein LAO05_10335 [Acidobacteriia bacterium]|nr:hypothetical protein [Terriglobia bacterium]
MKRGVSISAGYVLAVGIATLGSLLVPGGAAAQSLCGAGWSSQVFSFTGSSQSYTVPAGVTSLVIHAYGAQGATGGGAGATSALPGVTGGTSDDGVQSGDGQVVICYQIGGANGIPLLSLAGLALLDVLLAVAGFLIVRQRMMGRREAGKGKTGVAARLSSPFYLLSSSVL